MAYLNTAFHTQAIVSNAFLLRIGRREISICKDFRKRFYETNPLIECHAGNNAGHVEILLLRSWLVVFSKAQP